VWAQYTLRLQNFDRATLVRALKAEGIPTAIYYAKPLHRQRAFERYPTPKGGLPIADRLAEEVVSLPMHPYLAMDVQDHIVAAIKRALRSPR
jgi:dTDP-4-amino-4,6-dideoxygalactose transaminase